MHPDPTPRLTFREMTPDDTDAMAALLGDADVMRYYPRPKTRDEAQQWIEWNLRNYAEYGHGLWIIETPEGGFVGDCGLTLQEVDGERRLEIGYHVVPRWQGRGLASEAAAACVRFAFEEWGAREVIAIVNPGNTPSRRVAEKLGMAVERHTVVGGGLEAVVYVTTGGGGG